jgi:hypothetical protein
MRRAAAGQPVCVTVTDLSGIIVARSAFENGHPGPRVGAGHDR